MRKYLRKRILQQIILILAFVIIGFLYICYTWKQIDNEKFDNLLLLCESIEASLPKDEIKKLDASPFDIEKPQYRLVKNTLIDIIRINKNARFAYLYAQKNGKIFFIADSEPEGSKDYSPPGQEYTEVSLVDKQPFNDGKALVTDSEEDRWGTWRSVLVPIKDKSTGKVTAVFGMDFNAKSWNHFILFEVLESGVLVILLLIVVFISVRIKAKNTSLTNEIFQRKQAEEEIRLLANALKSINDCVSITDMDDKLIFVNETFLKTYGYTENELIGRSMDLILSPNNNPAIVGDVLSSTRRGSWEGELLNIRKNGSEFAIHLSTSIIYDSESKPIALIGVASDITEKKQAVQVLKENEEKYRLLFANNPQPMWIYDLETLLFLEVNQAAVNHYGYSREEFLLMTLKDIRPTEDLPALMEDIKHTTLAYNLAGQWRHIKKNEEIIFVEITSHSVNFNGRAARHVLVHDITARKKAEIALSQSNENLIKTNKELQDFINKINAIHRSGQQLQMLKKIKDLALDIITVLEKTVKYEFSAVLLSDDQGYNLIPFAVSDQGKGQTFLQKDMDFIKSHNIKIGVGIVGWVALHGESVRLGDVTKDTRYYSLRGGIQSELCVPLKVREKIIGVINIETSIPNAFTEVDQLILETIASQISIAIQNATMFEQAKNYTIELEQQVNMRKKVEVELIIAKEKAEESDHLKTAFLHNISHEVRTPMNAIVGFSGLLSEPNLVSEKRKYYTSIIEQSSEQLLSIINDIISIATIEAGQEIFNEKEIALNSALELLHQKFLPKAQEKNINLNLKHLLPENEANILSDSTKLVQVLTNLIGNAIKFTKQGYVNFGYKLLGNEIEFFVEDTGIGIPLDVFDKIFERFRQADNNTAQLFGGSGLGLSISKAYVELMGGKTWLKSELGKGSTFYFNIPYKRVPKESTILKQPVNGKTTGIKTIKTILIAEDEDSNFMLMVELLSPFNVNIIRAFNGLEAVEICKSDQGIDLVLMDMKMPLMNGYDATRQIKSFMPNLPIIGQTAYSTDLDKNKVLECGCNDYISKPINRVLLISKIKAQL